MKVEQEVDCSADDRDEDHMKEFISLSSLLTNLLQYVCEYQWDLFDDFIEKI